MKKLNFIKNLLLRPFMFFYPGYQSLIIDSFNPRPFFHTLAFTFVYEGISRFLIQILFTPRCPSAVFLTIVSAVINSINRCLLFIKFRYVEVIRFFHIFLKIFKRIPSALDAFFRIIFRTSMGKILTSTFYSMIDFVKSIISFPPTRVLSNFRHNYILP